MSLITRILEVLYKIQGHYTGLLNNKIGVSLRGVYRKRRTGTDRGRRVLLCLKLMIVHKCGIQSPLPDQVV